jgi:hypothetical protein
MTGGHTKISLAGLREGTGVYGRALTQSGEFQGLSC